MALDRALIRRVEEAISGFRPDVILVNSPDDTHQDHRAAAQAAVTAARYSPNLLFYEVPTTMHFAPTFFADIGGVLAVKVRLLKCHSSQVYKTRVKNLSIVESARSAAVFRGFQGRVKYAEGFMPQRAMIDSLMGLRK
jgi:LmbE family N-acetylglucosaminyl deacetylase